LLVVARRACCQLLVNLAIRLLLGLIMNYQLVNDEGMTNNQFPRKKYDLEERTGLFGEKIIRFAKKIRETWLTRSLISQLIRAGTSVGANYCEADDAH